MKILDLQFTKLGFTHTQIARQGKAAIYSREKDGNEHWEAVIIGSHNGFNLTGPDGEKNFVPPAETYPSPEMWGTKGFTCQSKERAWEKFNELRNQL